MSDSKTFPLRNSTRLDPATADDVTARLRETVLAANGIEALSKMIEKGLTDRGCGDPWMTNNLHGKAAEGVLALTDIVSTQAYRLAARLDIDETELVPLRPREPKGGQA